MEKRNTVEKSLCFQHVFASSWAKTMFPIKSDTYNCFWTPFSPIEQPFCFLGFHGYMDFPEKLNNIMYF